MVCGILSGHAEKTWLSQCCYSLELIMNRILLTGPVPFLFAKELRIDINAAHKGITMSLMSISTVQRKVATISLE